MAASRVATLSSTSGLSCIEAFFEGHAFAPHSHDTYAIGITLAGVQRFNYRGEIRDSLPHQVFVLHPCERHDGHQGDDQGFGYRIAYVEPALLRDATEVGCMPFVSNPISQDRALYQAVAELLTRGDHDGEELDHIGRLSLLADHLVRLGRCPQRGRYSIDERAMAIAKDYLSEINKGRINIDHLETATGLSRWQLTRQFRKAFGVSPYKFHLFRRLDRVREELGHGTALADAAVKGGFADQPHMSRHFKRAFGLSPGQWQQLICAGRSPV